LAVTKVSTPLNESAFPILPATELTLVVGTPERIAVLENNYIHLNSNLIELKNDFRAGMADIKITLDKQNDQTEKWLLIILAVLMGGDKGLSFMRKLKEGRKVS